MMLRQGWGMRPSGLRGNGFVGRDPLATGEAIGYDVVGIEGLVEFALLAVAQDGGFDGGERRGVVSGGEEVCHDLGPEAGEGFMIAGVFGVLAADGEVVEWDAFAHPAEGVGGAVFSGVEGADGDVRGVGPVGFGESAGFPLMDEGAESGVGGEEWVGWKHGLLFSRIGGNRNFTEARHTFKPWGMEERERLGFEIVAAVERACASLERGQEAAQWGAGAPPAELELRPTQISLLLLVA